MILPKVCLNSGWLAIRASSVPSTGYELTTSESPTPASPEWMEAVVPGTILTTLLKNQLIPDPFYGLQNEEIVDISEAGREFYTFWFYKTFATPQLGSMRAWIQFRAINYSAEVFLNGHKHTLPGGMFIRHTIDVTDWLTSNGANKLAVLVHPPDHPGKIPPEGGQGGDHDIAKDVAAQYVEGWDWIIPIRDRNTGIWDSVSISFTGPVRLSDPHLVSTLDSGFKSAYLHATVDLQNSSTLDVECTLKMQVTLDTEDDICLVEHVTVEDVSLSCGESMQHTIRPLAFLEPNLWWPNGLGGQPLYHVDIVVEVKNYGDSDSWSGRHGFRQIQSYIDPLTGGRKFEINGEPLFIRGANWIVSDGLLRLSKERYQADIKFHRDMNLNMIRIWGGALAERPLFYEACDEHGLLVWQEFWITGDCNGRGVEPSDPSWPLDHNLFLNCARDTVKLLRNHPSLALWVGGNEQCPPEDINFSLKEELMLHPAFRYYKEAPCSSTDVRDSEVGDPSLCLDGSRLYIQGSLWDGFGKGNGDLADGPYVIQNPEDFFKDGFYPYAFNPEIGSVGVPVSATMRSTMPSEALRPPRLERLPDGYTVEVPNFTWDYHKYIPYGDADKKVQDQIALYGEPTCIDDFCDKAQLANYIQYRALIESWNSRMWTDYTGVLIWKTQNPWPGLRGQLYDHLLDQTAGFYGVRSAAEAIHIQLNLHTYFVEVVNTTRDPVNHGSIRAEIWDLDGTCLHLEILNEVNIPPWTTSHMYEIGYHKLPGVQAVYFLLLKLMDNAQKVISRNFYWLHQPRGDYNLLDSGFRSRKVPISMSAVGCVRDGVCHLTVDIKNLTSDCAPITGCGNGGEICKPAVAFSLRLTVLSAGSAASDRRILPTFYTDNYFSLVPEESHTVRISFQLQRELLPELVLQGWNIEEIKARLIVSYTSRDGHEGNIQHVEIHSNVLF